MSHDTVQVPKTKKPRGRRPPVPFPDVKLEEVIDSLFQQGIQATADQIGVSKYRLVEWLKRQGHTFNSLIPAKRQTIAIRDVLEAVTAHPGVMAAHLARHLPHHKERVATAVKQLLAEGLLIHGPASLTCHNWFYRIDHGLYVQADPDCARQQAANQAAIDAHMAQYAAKEAQAQAPVATAYLERRKALEERYAAIAK